MKSDLRQGDPKVFDNLMDVFELAAYLNVAEKTVRDWKLKKKIPFQKVGRLVRFRRSAIEKWLSSQEGGHSWQSTE